MHFLSLAGCLFFSMVSAAAGITGTIQFQGDTVHLELSGLQNWDYDVKRVDKKGQIFVEMSVPPLEESTVTKLNNFKSEFVKSITVDKNGQDGKNVVAFALASDQIEAFDYLTDQPSRLIIDFYVNPQSQVAKESAKPINKVSNKGENRSPSPEKTTFKSTNMNQRKPATADVLNVSDQGEAVAQNESGAASFGAFDGGDPNYSRFSIKDYEIKEDAIIRAKDNYYIPFPMLEVPLSQWEKMKLNPPIYELNPQPTDENKQARLLLTLFEKGRYAVYLKTLKWFKEKYPQSEYTEVLDYMTADVYLTMWNEDTEKTANFEKAIHLYKEAVAKYPQSPLAERTSLKIGYLTLERGDYLSALRIFNDHISNKNFPDQKSLSKDLARMAMGLIFTRLNKWDDAVAYFNDIEKNSTNRDMKIEAAFRRGDVWTQAKKHTTASEEYQKALKKYPEAQRYFPNAYFNQAEALFWQKKYLPSLGVYRDFLMKYPADDNAAFAMTRMGEILDILGADKSRVMGAYLETYFRYGDSPKAFIARFHLLSSRMKGMKPKELNNAVQEIMTMAKKIDLPNIEQFATVTVAEGYNRRADYDKAIDLLSTYYKSHPNSVDVPLFTNRIESNINGKLQAEVEAGNFITALKTHSKFADNWLRNTKRLDTLYNVGRSFEFSGVPAEAEKYYKDVINKIYAIRGTQEAKEVQVKERVPSEDELNLRLAAVFLQEGKSNQAYENLRLIKNPEKLSEKAQIERIDISVQLLEKRGDIESAIRYLGELLRTWKGQPELVAAPYLKLAELQLKQNRTSDALQALSMIAKLKNESGNVSEVVHAKALEMIGDIHFSKNQMDLATISYGDLLQKYEEKRPLSSIRYKLGEIYFKRGEVQKAAEVWNDFKGDKSVFWKALAKEQLKNSEWRDGYKKYIKRIPAMSANEQGN